VDILAPVEPTFVGITGHARIIALQITTAIPEITIPTQEAFHAAHGTLTPATMVVLTMDSGTLVIVATVQGVTVPAYSVVTVAVGALVYSVDTGAHTVRLFGDVKKPSKLVQSLMQM
jgi:hypothetical protein